MHPHCTPVTDSRENTETGGWGIKLCEFSSGDKVMNRITTLVSEYLFLFLISGISLAGKAKKNPTENLFTLRSVDSLSQSGYKIYPRLLNKGIS